MAHDEKMVRKGKDEPRGGLEQQGRVQIALARQYAAELAERNWTADDTAELEKQTNLISSERAAQAEARAGSKGLTRHERAAVGDAKTFINKLRIAVPLALEDARRAQIDASEGDFQSGEKIGQSTPRILAYLDKVAGPVARLDDFLARYLDGGKASAQLAALRTRLQGADSAQERAVLDLPDATLEVYQAKGRTLALIERLNRVARLAFYGQAEIVGKFNKDLLLRARRERPDPPVG